jgi:hypothetical protein
MSPNPAGTALRVSTRDRNEYRDIAAMKIMPNIEKINPPL